MQLKKDKLYQKHGSKIKDTFGNKSNRKKNFFFSMNNIEFLYYYFRVIKFQ